MHYILAMIGVLNVLRMAPAKITVSAPVVTIHPGVPVVGAPGTKK
jgi:hypothetical protein